MADNFTTSPGTGGPTFASDDIGGVHVPRGKIGFGADGAYLDVSEANPLPVAVPSPLPVTGALTDTQLRAAAVAVSGTFWQATQPVSGPLTDAQLRATAVPVSMATVPTHPVTQSGTWTLSASTNAIGDMGVQYRANNTGAASIHHVVSAASANAAVVKASAGRLVGWMLSNTTTAWQFVKLHNAATAPTAGAGVVMTIALPPGGGATAFPPGGIGFSTGIGRTIVTGSADADATATTVGAVVGDLFFA